MELHQVKPPIDDRVFGFADLGQALKALPEGRHFGKVGIQFDVP